MADPLSTHFRHLWAGTARTNTEAFDDVFHCVPTDRVRNWEDYDEYFAQHFVLPGATEANKDKFKAAKEEWEEKTAGKRSSDSPEPLPEGKAAYGHVAPCFAGGVEAVKSRLGSIRGNLVEMPLMFLVEVKDLAKDGLTLNSLTEEIYT